MIFNNFKGMRPKQNPIDLPDGFASYCKDVLVDDGGVRPLRFNLQVGGHIYSPASTVRYFRSGGEGAFFKHSANVVASPIKGDAFKRFYLTESYGGLRVIKGGLHTDFNRGESLVGFKAPNVVPVINQQRENVRAIKVCFVYVSPQGDIVDGEAVGFAIHARTASATVLLQEGVDGLTVENYSQGDSYNLYLGAGSGNSMYLQAKNVYKKDEIKTGAEILPFSVVRGSSISVPATWTREPPKLKVIRGGDNVKSTSFVVTYFKDTGEETAPSPATEVIQFEPGKDKVEVTVPAWGAMTISGARVYMAVEGVYYLAGEWGGYSGNPFYRKFVFDGLTDDFSVLRERFNNPRIGSELTTGHYAPSPAKLRGLVGVNGGCLAGFVINVGSYAGMVCVSEPYQPHAWPDEYRFSLAYKPVALARVPDGLLVLCKGKHSLIVGQTPDVMNEVMLETQQTCYSALSVQVIGNLVVWASPDGVAVYGGGKIQVISADVWSREQWQSLNPATMAFGQYEGALLIFPRSGEGWMFDVGSKSVVRLSQRGVVSTFYDVEQDRLYMLIGTNLEVFNEDSLMSNSCKWVSKPLVLKGAKSLNSMRVESEGAVNVSLFKGDDVHAMAGDWTDAQAGNNYWSKAVQNAKPFRVGSSGRSRSMTVMFTLVGAARLRFAQLSETMRGLI